MRQRFAQGYVCNYTFLCLTHSSFTGQNFANLINFSFKTFDYLHMDYKSPTCVNFHKKCPSNESHSEYVLKVLISSSLNYRCIWLSQIQSHIFKCNFRHFSRVFCEQTKQTLCDKVIKNSSSSRLSVCSVCKPLKKILFRHYFCILLQTLGHLITQQIDHCLHAFKDTFFSLYKFGSIVLLACYGLKNAWLPTHLPFFIFSVNFHTFSLFKVNFISFLSL